MSDKLRDILLGVGTGFEAQRKEFWLRPDIYCRNIIDIRTRKDAVERGYEADWLGAVARELFTIEEFRTAHNLAPLDEVSRNIDVTPEKQQDHSSPSSPLSEER